MIVTHPYIDHYARDIALLNKYRVGTYITEDLTSDQNAYQLLLSMVKEKQVPQAITQMGDLYQIGPVELITAWPSRDLLTHSCPKGVIGESK